MTRAWLALLPALSGACTGTRAASTPWVVQPEGAAVCSPEATATFDEDGRPASVHVDRHAR